MGSAAILLAELENAVSRGSHSRRTQMLRTVTDLFLCNASSFREEQVALFDDIIGRLARDIETNIRAELARRLAPIDNAPINLMTTLARDSEAEVASPVLARSEVIGESILLETARAKSQDFLLAISQRRSLSEPITDVLVQRGDRTVVRTVASNQGASFSEFGFTTLIRRSGGDDELAYIVGSRRDIPPRQFQQLVLKASDLVRTRLLESDPGSAEQVDELLARLAGRIEAKLKLVPRDYADARLRLERLQRVGQLDETELLTCVRAGKFKEMVVALALMSGLSIEVVERAMLGEHHELLMIIVRACALSWTTVKQTLAVLNSARGLHRGDFDNEFNMFHKLQIATAQRTVRFLLARQAATVPAGAEAAR